MKNDDRSNREMLNRMAARPYVGETTERGNALVWAARRIEKLERELLEARAEISDLRTECRELDGEVRNLERFINEIPST